MGALTGCRDRGVDGGEPPAAHAELHGGWRRAAPRRVRALVRRDTSRSSPSRTGRTSTSCRAPRARVLDVGRRGARLMLEDGRAHVQVAHRPGADWQVQAGAFLIHVHGTAFFVEWNASQSRLDLQMESGVVSVDGPRSGDTVMLRGGQSLSVRLDGARVVATTPPPLAARAPASRGCGDGAGPPAVEAPPSPESMASIDTPRPAPGAVPPRARWSERLADGEAAGIVAEAQRRGIAGVLAGGQQRGSGGARGCRALSQPRPAGSARAARPAPSVPRDVASRGGVVPARAAGRRPGRSRFGRARLVRPLPARSRLPELMPPRRWGG